MKISELTKLTGVDIENDLLPIVDSSEGTTKSINPFDLLGINGSTIVKSSTTAASTLHITSNFRIDFANSSTADAPTIFSGYGICLTLGNDYTGWNAQILFETNGNIATRSSANWGGTFEEWKYVKFN